jgi:peptidoglycan/LPS O-acetylase OafA/YrhL
MAQHLAFKDRAEAGSSGAFHYRPEIDGLRALAVLPVIAFHAGFSWFSGGFVGVDVFFVISGYLITSILVTEQASGRFSVAGFYERRARRILPALFLIVATCLPLAWLLMTPMQLKAFAQSVIAVSLFGSNVLFRRTTGYFDTVADEQPLLHTWSLGVEEQYYIVFPIVLLLTWRLGFRSLWWAVGSVAVLSLGISQVLLDAGHESAPFFLAPPRAWELLIGSMLAIWMSREPVLERFDARLCTTLAAVGLALIVVSSVAYTGATQFPGIHALPPTLGTALIITFADRRTWIAKFLSLRWVVGVGLISYSAYLWHHPLFAFARVYAHETPSPWAFGGLALLSLALAYLTFRFVEKPCRDRSKFTRRQVFAWSAVGSVALIGLGTAGHLTRGFDEAYKARLEPDDLALAQKIDRAVATGELRALVDDGACHFSDRSLSPDFRARYAACSLKSGPAVIVLGDSHAVDLYNAMAMAAHTEFVVSLSMPSCRPYQMRAGCDYAQFEEFVANNARTIRKIFFTQSGEYLLMNPQSFTVNADAVATTQTYLMRLARHAPVVWVGPQEELVADLRSNNLLRGKTDFQFKKQIGAVDRYLAGLAMGDIAYVSKSEAIRLQPEDLIIDGEFTYSDRDHWSTHGERIFGARLLRNPTIAAALLSDGHEVTRASKAAE